MFDEKFWVAASFVILIALIYKKLSHIIANGLDKKAESIEDELKQASIIKKEAQEIRDSYLKEKKETIQKAQNLVDNAEKEAKKIIAEGKQDIERLINKKKEYTKNFILEIEEQEIELLRNRAIDSAIEKFEKYVQKNLKQDAFLEDSIKKLKSA